ncbi:unnamed protein product [Mytilus coruscus]|uniref:Uncharacterized protein n=1 Tax=Mytilus coruscus TaxID=42192 RepID=A0A6J8ER01_MYTCO|nr:unnamed protein product [Mytilus coruscus]
MLFYFLSTRNINGSNTESLAELRVTSHYDCVRRVSRIQSNVYDTFNNEINVYANAQITAATIESGVHANIPCNAENIETSARANIHAMLTISKPVLMLTFHAMLTITQPVHMLTFHALALLNSLWACITITKVKENKQKEIDDSIGCIWLLLFLATAAFVVGAVFLGGFSEHIRALQKCERNETKALIRTCSEDHCSDSIYKAFCICFIVGLVLFGLTTLCSCSFRSKENEKLHSRSHQVAPKTSAPKAIPAVNKSDNIGNPENDQFKKQNQTLTGEKKNFTNS